MSEYPVWTVIIVAVVVLQMLAILTPYVSQWLDSWAVEPAYGRPCSPETGK